MITNRDDLDRLIQSVFDGTADEAQLLSLRETLKSDPSARHLYYDHAGLHQALGNRFSPKNPSETAQLLVNARLRAQTRRIATVALLAAAAVIVLLGVLLHGVLDPEPEPMAVIESASGTVLTVSHTDPKSKLDAGELAEDSRVTVSQGSVELKMRNGSRAVILAPAAFSLRSERKLHLNYGTAWFHIEKEDHGFQITTPELESTDLGTEFGVISGPDVSDEIHVFKGQVIARSLNPLHHEETLDSGQSRTVDPAGRLKPLASRPEAFLVRLPETATKGLIANGDFESGTPPRDIRYGRSATHAMLPGWRFGREIIVVKPSAEGRWAQGGAINNHYPLQFGHYPQDQYLFLNGYLDDVAIWRKALTPREIEALWNRGSGQAAASVEPRAALASNWTFDSDLTDGVGSKDATAFGDANFQTATRKIGAGAAHFDGRGDYMTAGSRGDFAIGTDTMSVSFWFRVDDSDKQPSDRFLATGAGLNNQGGWALFMDDSAPHGDQVCAAMSDGTGRTVQKSNANRKVDSLDGGWHLAVAVFDAASATVSLYLDSILETTMVPETLHGGAVGVNVLTITSSTADAQVGFHADGEGPPDPEEASIYQSFQTEPGREYEVEFEMGGIFFHDARVEVTATILDGFEPRGEPLARHAEQRSRQAGTGYNPPASFRFTASSSTTTLVFTETSEDSSNADPVIDNIVVRSSAGEQVTVSFTDGK